MTFRDTKANWPRVRFDRIADSITERVEPAEAETDIYVGLEHLDPESLKIRRWGSPDDVIGTKLWFKQGDIIFGRRRAYQRKLAVAKFDGICSAHAMVIRARQDIVLPKFLPFFMQSDMFFERALQISVGSLSPTINWKALARQEFPLPPKDEQRRIAEVLWAADRAVEADLEVVRASTVALRSIRAEFFSSDKNSVKRIGDLCAKGGIQIGPFGSQLHASDYAATGVPVIMPTDMNGDRIVATSISMIAPEKAESLSQHRVRAGDIILPRRGELDRRAFVLPEQEGWICGTGSLRIRLSDSSLSECVLHALAAPQTLRWIYGHAVGTTMPNINAKIVGNIPVAVPEQSSLPRIISALRAAKQSLASASERLRKSRQLRKSLVNHLVN